MPDVDGGLVGGASLKADEFLKICARRRLDAHQVRTHDWLHTAIIVFHVFLAAASSPSCCCSGVRARMRAQVSAPVLRARYSVRADRRRSFARDGDARGAVLRDQPDARVSGRTEARSAEERERSGRMTAAPHGRAACAERRSGRPADRSPSRRRHGATTPNDLRRARRRSRDGGRRNLHLSMLTCGCGGIGRHASFEGLVEQAVSVRVRPVRTTMESDAAPCRIRAASRPLMTLRCILIAYSTSSKGDR